MNKMRFNLSVQCKTFCHLSFLLFCMFVKMDGQQFVEAFKGFFFCLFFSCKVGKIAMTGLAFTQLFLL